MAKSKYIQKRKAPLSIVEEPVVNYSSLNDYNALRLIQLARNGVSFQSFESLFQSSTFTLAEWSQYLHISERTIQRYESENKPFDPIQGERILQISMLQKYGVHVFGSIDKFNAWLHTSSIALGNITPKSLLDSSFGIDILKMELGKIEHGVLA